MSEDSQIVESAERTTYQQESHRLERTREWSRTAVRIAGVVGIAIAVIVLSFQIRACYEQSSLAEIETTRTLTKVETQYIEQLAACEAKQGAGACWRMQWQHCIDNGSARFGGSFRTEVCYPIVPSAERLKQ